MVLIIVLSHFDNRKNNFSILGEGLTYGTIGSFGSAEKNFNINFTETKITFFWAYIIMLIIVIYLLIEKKTLI